MELLVLSRSPAPLPVESLALNAKDLLARSDFVVVCCPLTETTRGMIGAAELDAMRRDGVLINVGRAEVVDEQALFWALKEERIAGAFLDVWYDYPTPGRPIARPSTMPFHELPNVRCTPHCSAWTDRLWQRRLECIARNIGLLRAGRPLENVVRRPGERRVLRAVNVGGDDTWPRRWAERYGNAKRWLFPRPRW